MSMTGEGVWSWGVEEVVGWEWMDHGSSMYLSVLALGVGAVEALTDSVHAGEDRVAAALGVLVVVVPHVGGVAEAVPAEEHKLRVASTKRLSEVGVGTAAVLLGVVVEDNSLVDLVAGGHVGAVVGGLALLSGGHEVLEAVVEGGVADTILVDGVDGIGHENGEDEGNQNKSLGHSQSVNQ